MVLTVPGEVKQGTHPLEDVQDGVAPADTVPANGITVLAQIELSAPALEVGIGV